MSIRSEVRVRAYNLYSWGVPITEIANKLGIDQATIHRIKKTEQWEKIQAEDLQFASEKAYAARKRYNMRIINGGIDLVANKIATGNIKVALSDLPKLIQVQRLEGGESTENIAIKGELSIEERYKAHLEKKKRKESGTEEFIPGVLPNVTEECKQ